MDDLAFLRERIESYADYTNDDARRLSDDQIRAYLGVALAELQERLHPVDRAGETLARIILRCQFADQHVVRALDTDDITEAELAALHQADHALVELADRAAALAATDVDGYLAAVESALDARAKLITTSTPAPKVPPR